MTSPTRSMQQPLLLGRPLVESPATPTTLPSTRAPACNNRPSEASRSLWNEFDTAVPVTSGWDAALEAQQLALEAQEEARLDREYALRVMGILPPEPPVLLAPIEVVQLTPLIVPHDDDNESRLPSTPRAGDAEIRRLVQHVVRGALRAWAAQAHDLQRVARLCAHMLHRQLSRSLVTWAMWYADRCYFLQHLRRALQGNVLRAWHQWQATGAEHRLKVDQLHRCGSHLLHRSMSRAWRQWKGAADERKLRMEPLHRCVNHLLYRNLSRALNMWSDLIVQLPRLRRAATSLRYSRVAAAWNSWKDHTALADQTQGHLHRASMRFRFQQLARCWTSWRMNADKLRTQQAHLRRSAVGLSDKRLAVWLQWSSRVDESRRLRKFFVSALDRQRHRALNAWVEFASEGAVVLCKMHLVSAKLLNGRSARALASWKDFTLELAWLHRSLLRATNQSLAHVWYTWTSFLSEQEASDQVLRRAGARLRDPRMPMFHVWVAAVKTLLSLSAAAVRMTNRRISPAWNSWWAACKAAAAHVAKLTRAGSRMRDPRMPAWNTWMASIFSMQRFRRAAARIGNRRAAAAWESWVLHNESAAAQSVKLRRATTKLCDKRMPAWTSWVAAKDASTRLRRAAIRIANRRVAVAWSSWVAHVDEAADHSTKLKRAGALLRDPRMAAWNSWAACLATFLHRRRAAMRIANQRMVSAWTAWLAFSEDSASDRALLTRATARFTDARVKSWNTWCACTANFDHLRRAATRLVCQRLTRCWMSWSTHVTERREQQSTMRKSLVRLIDKRSPAWTTWIQSVSESLKQRRRLTAAFNRQRRQAWNTWASHAEQGATTLKKLRRVSMRLLDGRSAHALMSWSHRVAELTGMRRALLRASNRSLSQGWTAWASYLSELKATSKILQRAKRVHDPRTPTWNAWVGRHAKFSKLRRMAMRIMNRNVGIAWSTWLLHREAAAALATKLSRACARLRDTRSPAWNTWAAHTACLVRLHRVAVRVSNQSVACAWSSWEQHTVHAIMIETKLRRVGVRLSDNRLQCWTEWHEYCAKLGRLRIAATRLISCRLVRSLMIWKITATQLSWQKMRLLKAAIGMTDKRMPAWQTWTSRVSKVTAVRDKLLCASMKLLNGRCLRAWGSWKEHSTELSQLRRTLLHAMHHSLSQSWRAWLFFVSEKDAAEDRLCRVRRLRDPRAVAWRAIAARRAAISKLRGIGTRIANRAITSAWNTWRSHAEGAVAYAATLTRAVARLKDRRLPAWNTWVALQASFVALRRVAMRITNRSTVSAWIVWASYAAYIVAEKAKLTRASACFNDKRLHAWYAWREQSAKFERLRKAAIRLIGQRLARCWVSWSEAVCQRKQKQMQLRRSLAALTDKRVQAWRAWLALVSCRHQQRQRLSAVFNSQIRHAWNAWALLASGGTTARQKLRRAAAKLLNGRSAKAFEAWKTNSSELLKISQVLTRALNQQLSRSWDAWWSFVDDKDEANERLVRAVAWLRDPRMRTWSSWASWLAGLRGLRRSAVHIFNRRVACAWNTWQCQIQMMAERSAALRRAGARLRDKRIRAWTAWVAHCESMLGLRRVATRMIKRSTVAAFTSWHEFTEQAAADAARLTRAGARLADKRFPAWTVWLAYATKFERLRNAATRLSSRRQLSCWMSWAENAAELREGREHLRKAVIGLSDKRVSAWRTWAKQVAEAKESQTKLRQACMVLLDGRCMHALAQWKMRGGELAALNKTMRCAGSQLCDPQVRAWKAWTDTLDSLLRLRRAALRIVSRQVASAFAAWVGRLEEAEANEAFLERAGARLRDDRFPVFSTWREYCSSMLSLRRAAMRIVISQVAAAFGAWVARLEDAEANEEFLERTGARLRDGRFPLFSTWREYSCKNARLQWIARGLLNARLVLGLRSWVAFAMEATEQQQHLRRCAALFNKLLQPWNSWRAHCASLSVLRRLVMRGLNRVTYQALQTWIDATHQGKCNMLRLRRAAARLTDPRCRLWESWFQHTTEMKLLRRAMSRIFDGRLSRGWRSWCLHIDDANIRDQSNLESLSLLFDTQLARGWKTWRAKVMAQGGMLKLTMYSVGLLLSSSIRRSFVHWRSCKADKPKTVTKTVTETSSTGAVTDNDYQLDMQATARRLVRLCEVNNKAIAEFDPRVLRYELDKTRLLRTILRAWGRLAALERDAHRITRRSPPTVLQTELFGRSSIYGLVRPETKSCWPQAWQDFFGWTSSWRDMADWLDGLGIATTDIGSLQTDMRHGRIYTRLVKLLFKAHYMPARCSAMLETGYPGAMQLLKEFFTSMHVRGILGETNVRRATMVHGHDQPLSIALHTEPRSVRGRDSLVTSLKVLTYIRVVMEVDMPDKFVSFCGGGYVFRDDARSALNGYEDTLLDRHTSSLAWYAHEHKKCAAWCKQCGELALAQHNLCCGKCAVRVAIARSGALDFAPSGCCDGMFDKAGQAPLTPDHKLRRSVIGALAKKSGEMTAAKNKPTARPLGMPSLNLSAVKVRPHLTPASKKRLTSTV